MVADYVGAEYVPGGRDIETGIDCYGLVVEFYRREFGIELDSLEKAAESPVRPLIFRRVLSGYPWVEIPAPAKDGDILSLSYRHLPFHCAIFIGNGQMLHADEGVGVVIERIDSLQWRHRHLGYYRHTESP